MTETIVKRQKAKSKGFSVLGVPLGATLTFRKDPSITCVVVDGKNKVEYLGETYLISGLAKKLMNSPISGYHAFKYNGVLLAKLGETSDDAPVSANNPTETAQVAQQATTLHTPQFIPLPRPQEASVRPSEATTEEDAAVEVKDIPPNPLEESFPDEETES